MFDFKSQSTSSEYCCKITHPHLHTHSQTKNPQKDEVINERRESKKLNCAKAFLKLRVKSVFFKNFVENEFFDFVSYSS